MAFIKLDKRYLTIANLLDDLRYTLKMPILSLPKYFYEDWGMFLARRTFFKFRAVYSPPIDSLNLKDIPDQLSGSFQPFAEIANDFLISICPYFSEIEALKDLFQPILGIANLLKGACYISASVLLIPLLFIICPLVILLCPDCTWDKKTKYFKDCFGLGGGILLSWLIDGIGTVIHGGLQIVFTPAIPIRMAMRGVSTLIGIYKKSQYPEINTIDDVDPSPFPTKVTPKVKHRIYSQQTKESLEKIKEMNDVYQATFEAMDARSEINKFKNQ